MINKPQKIPELFFILEKLTAIHRQLLEVLELEYAQMIAIDAKGLVETAHTKEVLLSEIWGLEQLRVKTVSSICEENKIENKEISLLKLSEHCVADEKQKLLAYRESLNLLLKRAKEQNTQNMSFAESSLLRIEEMKRNVLGMNNNVEKENYSSEGVRQSIEEHGGRLLSTEA